MGKISVTVFLVGTLAVASQQLPTKGEKQDDAIVRVPGLGTIQGRTKTTTVGGKTFYNFRNIPFANSVDGDLRFSQPVQKRDELGTDAAPYDATKSGPLCPQLGLNETLIEIVLKMTIDDLVQELVDRACPIDRVCDLFPIAELVIKLLEDLFEMDLFGKTMEQILMELLDEELSVHENCLHLAVSTPTLPGKNAAKQGDGLPVMVFIYGGGFTAGTQMMMGYERLGDATNEVVLVALNYRLGPLGFMCVDHEDSAGNMGLLDQIVGLEWVRDNIAAFGGNPNDVTIFGESAGSASVSMLMLSPEAQGLFNQVIAESGSAIAPWAYEYGDHEEYARGIAEILGCNRPDLGDLIFCMKTKSTEEINDATDEFEHDNEAHGGLGFAGINGCGQTKGARKVFASGDVPRDILTKGHFRPVKYFGGANIDEGLLPFTHAFNYQLNATMQNDEHWLKYEALDYMLRVAGMTHMEYVFSPLIEDEFFLEGEMGDFATMGPALVDILGAMMLKSPTYETVVLNSKHSESFFYSMDERSLKSFNWIFSAMDMDIPFPPVEEGYGAHADELLYVFDVPIPIALCPLNELFVEIGQEFEACMEQNDNDVPAAEACLMDHEGAFKTGKYGPCIDGRLTSEEQEVSDAMCEAWTNFAANGNPSPGSDPWTHEDNPYFRFKYEQGQPAMTVQNDYERKYKTTPH